MAGMEKTRGELGALQGASGAKQDLTVQTILNREFLQQVQGARKQIDAGLDLSVYQNQVSVDQMKNRISGARGAYDPGSAVRNLYNYRRGRITGEEEIRSSYLQ